MTAITYDASGNQLSVHDPNNVGADMLYDALGRNTQRTDTYPDSSTSDRSYHPTGALNQLKLDGSTISTRSYDDGRRLTSEVLGNGITETRAYRNDNLLSTISFSNTNIGNLGYSWDSNKNKTAETISGVMSGTFLGRPRDRIVDSRFILVPGT